MTPQSHRVTNAAIVIIVIEGCRLLRIFLSRIRNQNVVLLSIAENVALYSSDQVLPKQLLFRPFLVSGRLTRIRVIVFYRSGFTQAYPLSQSLLAQPSAPRPSPSPFQAGKPPVWGEGRAPWVSGLLQHTYAAAGGGPSVCPGNRVSICSMTLPTFPSFRVEGR
jgi:hypothetical protein